MDNRSRLPADPTEPDPLVAVGYDCSLPRRRERRRPARRPLPQTPEEWQAEVEVWGAEVAAVLASLPPAAELREG